MIKFGEKSRADHRGSSIIFNARGEGFIFLIEKSDAILISKG